MNNIFKKMDDINKDLKDQPKFTDDIGSRTSSTLNSSKQSILKFNIFHGNLTSSVIILVLRYSFGFIAGDFSLHLICLL